MKTKELQQKKKLSWIYFIIIISLYLIHSTIDAIITYNTPSTSFPWWSSFIILGLYYLLPLLISIFLIIFYKIKIKNKK